MLSIPLYIVLFLYLLFLAVFFIFIFVNLYHIIGSGSATFASFFVTFIILALAMVTMYGTWVLLPVLDWREPLIVLQSSWLGSKPF